VVERSQNLALNLSKFTILRIFACDNQDVKVPCELTVVQTKYFLQAAAKSVSKGRSRLNFFCNGESYAAVGGFGLINHEQEVG